MLTADQVLARRRGDSVRLVKLRPEQRARIEALAEAYIAAAAAAVGETRAAFDARCAEVDCDPGDRRVAAGLRKLVTDRCRFAMDDGVDPAALRRALFEAAATARRGLGADAELDRTAVIAEVAGRQQLSPAGLEDALFADLKQAHRLAAFEPIGAAMLVERWHLGQAQAVLLKATRVVVDIDSDHPAAYRGLFQRLKFHRLLFVLQPRDDGGYRLEIDGPFSLFRSVTKYGLQLALLLPALSECCAWRLCAEVVWGRERRPLKFELAGGRRSQAPSGPPISDEIATLLRQFEALDSGWTAAPSTRIVHLPGAGLCVADVEFTQREGGARVLLEVLGYWSRPAVWRRVELVEAGLPDRILFAVSDRLRVSEAVLGEDLPGALYVFKGRMSARRIAERLDAMVAAAESGPERRAP